MNALSTAIRVLLIEDDSRLALFTSSYLVERGLTVEIAVTRSAALAFLNEGACDVVVLDVMLPGHDGFSLCKAIRSQSDVPIIMVTARGEETDRVLGLELGADDYMVKPFSPRELLARLQAQVRRHRGDLAPRTRELKAGPLTVNTDTATAFLLDRALNLTHTEFLLLTTLMQRPGRVLSREQLLELMKGGSDEAFDRAIDVQVSRLRQKLAEVDPVQTLIRTVRGVGYMLCAEASR